MGIEPRTSDLQIGCPTDCATRPAPVNSLGELKIKQFCNAMRPKDADQLANSVVPDQTV